MEYDRWSTTELGKTRIAKVLKASDLPKERKKTLKSDYRAKSVAR